MLPNQSDTSQHSDDWETVSESDSLDRPLPKHDMHHLTEIPMHILTESNSIKWFAPMLNFRHENKCYEHLMVSYYIYLPKLSPT